MKSKAAKWIGAVALLLVAAIYIWNPWERPTWSPIGRFIGIQFFESPGLGMQSAIGPGGRVLICFDAYKHKDLLANDIVVFRVPGDEELLYLKRVAAVAGSTIEIRESELLVNGKRVTSPFWWAGQYSSPYTSTLEPIELPPGSFFALGDNVEQSIDSRRFGPVPYKNIVGGLCADRPAELGGKKT